MWLGVVRADRLLVQTAQQRPLVVGGSMHAVTTERGHVIHDHVCQVGLPLML